MKARILVLQEKPENIANLEKSLPDCQLIQVRTITEALRLLKEMRIDLIVSAVHLEGDGSVYSFLQVAKDNPNTKKIPFTFYCSQSSNFARSVRHGLQIAAHALGADKYITMEQFDAHRLRAEFAEFLPALREGQAEFGHCMKAQDAAEVTPTL